MKNNPLLRRFVAAGLVFACLSVACKRPAPSHSAAPTPSAPEAESPPALAQESPLPEPTPGPPQPQAASEARRDSGPSAQDAYFTLCNGNRIDLSDPVNAIAANISAESVMYDQRSENFADCSGIFHRVLDSLRVRCAGVSLPGKSFRSSRDLALWFHQQGHLQLIQDPLASTAAIRPGAVMFYGGRGASSGSSDLESVLQGINHVGVVVGMDHNGAGEIINYDLFHGQWVGKMASVTSWHKRDPSRADYPPFGNGSEPWVAVAMLLPEAAER